ncbi:MAG: MotE family protein [Caulobacterales bacterium]|nr:MotE family protein [Caulobacterales bacterium]
MKSVPRILPLVGVAIGGVLAVNALAGARDLPSLLSGAQAFAEGAAKTAAGKPAKAAKAKDAKADAAATAAAPTEATAAPTGLLTDTAAALPPASIAPKPVCAPTAAELAKQAGLSPAELQVLQSLGERRGQLDQRESDLNTQLALMAAAEAKLDAKLKALTGLKGEIQGLLTESDAKQAAEIDRLVKVYEGMKPKDAAPRFVLLDDSVRIPIAAKMKDRALSSIVALMPAADAKKLTESLARRYSDAMAAAAKADQVASAAADKTAQAASDPTKTAPAKPTRTAAKKPVPRKKAPATQQAANASAAAKATTPAPAAAAPATAAPAAAAPAAKTG